MKEPIKIDGNKAYFESPYSFKKPTIIGIGSEVIAFGEINDIGEKFIHFKIDQWEEIKKFIDNQLKKSMTRYCEVCKKTTKFYNAFGSDDKAICCTICKSSIDR